MTSIWTMEEISAGDAVPTQRWASDNDDPSADSMTAGGKPVPSHASSCALFRCFDYGWRALADSRRICAIIHVNPEREEKTGIGIKLASLQAFVSMYVDPLCNFRILTENKSFFCCYCFLVWNLRGKNSTKLKGYTLEFCGHPRNSQIHKCLCNYNFCVNIQYYSMNKFHLDLETNPWTWLINGELK